MDYHAIDFGTSNSLLTVVSESGRKLTPINLDQNANDPTILKSIIFCENSGKWSFGNTAINQYTAEIGHGRLIKSIKRFLPDPNFANTKINNDVLNLSDIIARFLRFMRDKASEQGSADVEHLILGRPALYAEDGKCDELAENRMRLAANAAGYKYVEFVPEPLAAAKDFVRHIEGEATVFIADFGGGTSDFSVVKLSKEGFSKDDVLAIGGLNVAGDKFDGAIMKNAIGPEIGTEVTYTLPMGENELHLPKHLINKLCSPADMSFLSRKEIKKILKDAQRWSLDETNRVRMERLFLIIEEHLGYRLFDAIANCKHKLSDEDALFQFVYPGFDFETQIKKEDFCEFSMPVVEKIMSSLKDTMKMSQLGVEQLDYICITGGTAKIQSLHNELEKFFGKEKLRKTQNFHSVVSGLAEFSSFV